MAEKGLLGFEQRERAGKGVLKYKGGNLRVLPKVRCACFGRGHARGFVGGSKLDWFALDPIQNTSDWNRTESTNALQKIN